MQAALITIEVLGSIASLYFFHRCNKKGVNFAAAVIIFAILAHAITQLKQIGVH